MGIGDELVITLKLEASTSAYYGSCEGCAFEGRNVDCPMCYTVQDGVRTDFIYKVKEIVHHGNS